MYEELFIRVYYPVLDDPRTRIRYVDHLSAECVRHPASGWWDIHTEQEYRFWICISMYNVVD
jgi:hypothetical protein